MLLGLIIIERRDATQGNARGEDSQDGLLVEVKPLSSFGVLFISMVGSLFRFRPCQHHRGFSVSLHVLVTLIVLVLSNIAPLAW